MASSCLGDEQPPASGTAALRVFWDTGATPQNATKDAFLAGQKAHAEPEIRMGVRVSHDHEGLLVSID